MGIAEGRIYEERAGKYLSDARAIKISGAMGIVKRLIDNPKSLESIERRSLLRILSVVNSVVGRIGVVLRMPWLENFPRFRRTDSLQDILDLTIEACEVGRLNSEFRKWIQANFSEIAKITGLDDFHINDMI